MIKKNSMKIWTAKTDLLFAAVKLGIKLWAKAPSAKIRLNRFGSLKAIKKISLKIFAPKKEAVNRSLIKPRIREKSIPILFVKIDLNISPQ